MAGSAGDFRSLAKPVFLTALRLLAAKRVTKAQLYKKLRDRGFAPDVIRDAVSECERRGYLDDRTFAQLFVTNAIEKKPVGRLRLLRDLIKQGIEPELAREAIAETEAGEEQRLDEAIRELQMRRPGERYDRLARRLVTLGFTAPSIARALRKRAQQREALGEFEEIK